MCLSDDRSNVLQVRRQIAGLSEMEGHSSGFSERMAGRTGISVGSYLYHHHSGGILPSGNKTRGESHNVFFLDKHNDIYSHSVSC